MFRKRQTKVLRVKDGKKRLSDADSDRSKLWELTFPGEVIHFLRDSLKLKSFQILDGPTIYISDPDYCDEFDDYFWGNEIVDIVIPKSANLDGWKLQPSAYDV